MLEQAYQDALLLDMLPILEADSNRRKAEHQASMLERAHQEYLGLVQTLEREAEGSRPAMQAYAAIFQLTQKHPELSELERKRRATLAFQEAQRHSPPSGAWHRLRESERC